MYSKRLTIALLTDHFLGDYQTVLRDAVEFATREFDVDFICLVGRSLDSPNKYEKIQNDIFNDISSEAVSGMVVLGANLSMYAGKNRIVEFCRKLAPIPVCNIGLELPNIPSIIINNRAIAQATEHLIENHDCKKIAYIGGPLNNEEAQIRREAFIEALDKNGVFFDRELEKTGEFTISSGAKAVEELLAQCHSFDALVVANDTMAIGAMSLLKRQGISVPNDVKVTGFDDTPSARFHSPSLSTVRQPLEEMGHRAVECVIRQIKGESVEMLTEVLPKFIKRQSCGCVHGKRDVLNKEPIYINCNNLSTSLLSSQKEFESLLIANTQIPEHAYSHWASRLINALFDDFKKGGDSFVSELNSILNASGYRMWLIDELQNVISLLREQFRNNDRNIAIDVDSIWHECRLLLADAAACAQMKDQTAADLTSTLFLRRAAADLPSKLTERALVEAISSELEAVGFENGWVSIFSSNSREELDCIAAVFEGSVITASDCAGDSMFRTGSSITNLSNRFRYKTKSIIPDFLVTDRRTSYVVIPLSIGEDRLGVIGLEFGAAGIYYEILREHLSSYLKSVAIFQNRVEQLQAEADRHRQELEMQHRQKLESLGVLAGGIAHDFNNMLSAMAGNLDVAILDIEDGNFQLEPIMECKSVVKHASALCKQLLAYSGKGQFLIRRVDINRLLNDLRDLLDVSVSKKAELIFELQERLPDIEADVAQINQIFVNLVINAAEAVGSSGGKVQVRTYVRFCNSDYFEGDILGSKLPPENYVVAEVVDNGSGIEKESLKKIFDPFFSTKFVGRGLGLAAVLGIVKGHRGSIMVDSKVGQGTMFRVVFPALPKISIVPKPTSYPPQWSAKGIALIVDDEPTVLRAGARLLKKLGFSVLTASDGLQGIEIFTKQHAGITVVILDITMPGKGGIATMTAMREINADIPIILTSGYSEQQAMNSLGDEAPSSFLQKPYDLQQMTAVLRRVFSVDDILDD